MFIDWILGVVFRPGITFDRSRDHLRFGYWWIVLTVITLEAVIGIYGPDGFGTDLWFDGAIFVAMYSLILFDLQALILMGSARLVAGWQLSWVDSHKYVGLLWSLLLLEDAVTFYPALKGLDVISLWLSAFFSLWYVIVMAIGLRRVSGQSGAKSLLITLLAGVTWRGGLLALSWWAVYFQQ